MNIREDSPVAAARPHCRRPGMTLVELLVVIGIIAILITLLLPTINAVLESSRRSTCFNNQKQIALAITQYAAANRQIPGWRNLVQQANGSDAYPSWPVLVLPQLDQQAVFDQWISGTFNTAIGGAQNGNMKAPMLGVFVCPSSARTHLYRGPDGKPSPGVFYAGNAGTGRDTATGDVFVGDGVMVDTAPRIKRPTPIFGYPSDTHWCEISRPDQQADITAAGLTNPIVIRQAMTPDFINANDGLSNTLLLTERSGVSAAYWDTRYQTDRTRAPPARPWLRFGEGLFHVQTSDWMYINTPSGEDQIGIASIPAFGFPPTQGGGEAGVNPRSGPLGGSPTSRHLGGAVAAFCDGRTLFLSNELAPHVWAQLVTSSQTNSAHVRGFLNLSPTRPYILDEKDYQ
jgi:prepilin-type N-terminal cleavage/methylation domain-containing protein